MARLPRFQYCRITLVADVHDLALYTKLNITGFMKILKVRHVIVVPASSRDRD